MRPCREGERYGHGEGGPSSVPHVHLAAWAPLRQDSPWRRDSCPAADPRGCLRVRQHGLLHGQRWLNDGRGCRDALSVGGRPSNLCREGHAGQATSTRSTLKASDSPSTPAPSPSRPCHGAARSLPGCSQRGRCLPPTASSLGSTHPDSGSLGGGSAPSEARRTHAPQRTWRSVSTLLNGGGGRMNWRARRVSAL